MTVPAILLFLCSSLSWGQVVGANRNDDAERNKFPYVDLSTEAAARQNIEIPSHQRPTAQSAFVSATGTRLPFSIKKILWASASVHYMPRYDYFGKLDPLHIADSDVIAIGSVEPTGSHLTKGGGFVYSTYKFQPQQFLKGTFEGYTVTLERKGGMVLLPNGKRRFVGVYNFGLPVAGYRYVLFLKTTPSEHSFEILGGFALLGSRVMSLDVEGRRFDSLDEQAVISMIQAKLAAK